MESGEQVNRRLREEKIEKIVAKAEFNTRSDIFHSDKYGTLSLPEANKLRELVREGAVFDELKNNGFVCVSPTEDWHQLVIYNKQ